MSVFLIRTLQFILSITLLVFLHEGGHFLFAKLFKTRVSRFYIFANYKFHIFSSYDNWWRRLWGKKPLTERDNEGVHFGQEVRNWWYTLTGKKDKVVTENVGNKKYNDEVGTEYGIGWLPIGGYCQIDGMIDETQTAEKLAQPAQPWEFRSKKAYQRLLIMAGGVMVNFILALVIYSAVFYTWGEDYIAMKDMTYGMKFNDQAKELGFKDGDIMLASDQTTYKSFTADVMRDLTSAHEVTVMRDGKEVKVQLPGDLNLLEMFKSDPVFCRPLIPSDVDSVLAGTPAAKLGLQKDDRIISIGGNEIDSWNAFTYEISRINDALTDAKTPADSLKTLTTEVVWVRHAACDTMTAKVALEYTEDGIKLGIIQSSAIRYYKPTHVDYSIVECVPAGVNYALGMLGGYVSDLKYVASKEGAKSLGGFGAIGSMFPPVWDWHMFWMMTAFLSIILAFMNIIPIPGLDGGHILFLLVEVVTRKPVSLKFMQVAQNVGMGLLLLLMVVANLNDILRWLGFM